MEENRIGLLICEDHRVLSDAMAMLFEIDRDIELLARPVSDPFEAIELARRLDPDVLLMDVDLGASIDGIEATKRVKQGDGRTRVLLITAMQDEDLLVRAVEAGASGLIRKTEHAEKVISAVKAVAAGESLIDPMQLTRVLQQVAQDRENRKDPDLLLGQLTQREREVLQLLAEGQKTEEIAAWLTLSTHTVQTHVRNILAKLNVSSKLEAVVFAARHGAIAVGGRSAT